MENFHDLSYSPKQFTLRLIRLQTNRNHFCCDEMFWEIVLHHLLDLTKEMLDPFQFAYKPNRSIEDAILILLHNTFLHTNNPKSSVRILFADFSPAFNTIEPYYLAKGLIRLNISPKLVISIIKYCDIENSSFGLEVYCRENDPFLQAFHKDAFCLLFCSHHMQMTAQELKTLSL